MVSNQHFTDGAEGNKDAGHVIAGREHDGIGPWITHVIGEGSIAMASGCSDDRWLMFHGHSRGRQSKSWQQKSIWNLKASSLCHKGVMRMTIKAVIMANSKTSFACCQ